MNHWLDRERRKIAQDAFARLVRSYWIYVYLSGLIRYHL
jgi:hypothetical protein